MTREIKVFYFTKTGNTKAFADCLDVETTDISEMPVSDKSFVLMTPTYFYGQVPEEVVKWMTDNKERIIGVIGFGNRNWGAQYFTMAADKISESYDVPILARVEMRGTNDEIEQVNEILAEMGGR